MNFADVLVGSLVFSLASGSSLDLTARMGRSLIQQRQDRERMEQIDGEMLAGEQALLRSGLQEQASDAACADPAGVLVAVLEGSSRGPLPAGLVRRVERLGDRQVRLQISGGGAHLDRQRLFTPAAYGLCTDQAAALPPTNPTSETPAPSLEPAP